MSRHGRQPAVEAFVDPALRVVEDTASEPSAPPQVELIDYLPSISEALSEAWRERHLIRPLVGNLWKQSFARTYLGPGWILIQVFMDTFGRALIFGSLIGLTAPAGVPYFIFLIGGMLGWRTFQRTLYVTTRGFDKFSRFTRELVFPLLLVPIASSGPVAIEFVIYIGLLVLAFGYYGAVHGELHLNLSPELLLVPVGILWALVFAWGIAMVTGPVNARTRDMRHFIRTILPLWLYVTPVVYPLEHLHGTARTIAELNPLAPIVEMVKVGLLGIGVLNPISVVWSLALTVGTFLGGVWFVSRYGYRVAGIGQVPEDDDDEDEEILGTR